MEKDLYTDEELNNLISLVNTILSMDGDIDELPESLKTDMSSLIKDPDMKRDFLENPENPEKTEEILINMLHLLNGMQADKFIDSTDMFLYNALNPDVQNEYVNSNFSKLLDYYDKSEEFRNGTNLAEIWEKLQPKGQEENIQRIFSYGFRQDIWDSTDENVRNENIEVIGNALKGRTYDLTNLWTNLEYVQKVFYFTNMIEFMKDEENHIYDYELMQIHNFYNELNDEDKLQQEDFVENIFNSIVDANGKYIANANYFYSFWDDLDINEKRNNISLIPKMVDACIDKDENISKANFNSISINLYTQQNMELLNNYPELVSKIYNSAPKENIKDKRSILIFWNGLSDDLKTANIGTRQEIINNSKNKDGLYEEEILRGMSRIWNEMSETDKEQNLEFAKTLLKSYLDKFKSDKSAYFWEMNTFGDIFTTLSKEAQRENVNLLDEVSELTKENISVFRSFYENVWSRLDDELKAQSIDFFKNGFENYTSEELGTKKINILGFYRNFVRDLEPAIKSKVIISLSDSLKSNILKGNVRFLYENETNWDGTKRTSNEMLSEIFQEQDETTQTEIFNTLAQINPEEILNDEKIIDRYELLLVNFWNSVSKETQQNNILFFESTLNKLQELYDNYGLKLMLRHTKIELSKDQFQSFATPKQQSNGTRVNENIDKVYELYKKILPFNENLLQTLNIDTLDVFGDKIEFSKLIRLASTDIALQTQLLYMIKSNEGLKEIFFNTINNNEYWDMDISLIENNLGNYLNITTELKQPDTVLSEDEKSNLGKILTKENYFNIKTLDDIKNYEEIKRNVCFSILRGEKLGEEYEKINTMSADKRIKFAILELQYGLSFDEAENIVEKYGTDINLINNAEYASVIEKIKSLKRIIYCEDILELYEKAKDNLDEVLGKSDDSYSVIDGKALNLYAELYHKELNELNIDKNFSFSEVTQGNSKVPIISVSPYSVDETGKKKRAEIAAFARVEGAYADWKEPNNFREALDTPNIDYHGNCKSFIRSSNLAFARPKGPIYGYITCYKNTLKLMAPWDIASGKGNTSFAINSLKYDERGFGLLGAFPIKGVQFRIPKNNTDNTRHGHNESVSERLVFDGEKFTKDEPNYVMFVFENGENAEQYENLLSSNDFNEKLQNAVEKERKIEKNTTDKSLELTDEEAAILNAERWRISKKAAENLNVPLVTLDRDEFRECEETRIQQLMEALKNPESEIDFVEDNDKNLSQKEILKTIIVEFENNITSNFFAKKKGMFSSEGREEIYNQIHSYINSLKEKEPELAKEFLETLSDVVEKEFLKSYSNTNTRVAIDDFKNFYENKVIALRIEQENFQKCQINPLVPTMEDSSYFSKTKSAIMEINKTNYYDDKNQHSIEHIDKVILFSGMLAKEEGLEPKMATALIAAAAFHDSGRMTDSFGRHAESSAAQVKKYLEENPTNPFGITQENIGIIQTAIHYHEHREPQKGKLDKTELRFLAKRYNVKPEDFEAVLTISTLLKDADALDRLRFADSGKLDIRFLKSESSKKGSFIAYAKQINEEYAKEVLRTQYGIENDEESYVKQLHDKRKANQYEKEPIEEKNVSLEKILEIISLDGEVQGREVATDDSLNKNSELLSIYNEFGTDRECVATGISILTKTRDGQFEHDGINNNDVRK